MISLHNPDFVPAQPMHLEHSYIRKQRCQKKWEIPIRHNKKTGIRRFKARICKSDTQTDPCSALQEVLENYRTSKKVNSSCKSKEVRLESGTTANSISLCYLLQRPLGKIAPQRTRRGLTTEFVPLSQARSLDSLLLSDLIKELFFIRF